MNNSYFWSADDAKAGRCSFGSIGIERRYDPPDQLGDVWADDDAAAGRCLASEVGQPRRAPAATFAPPDPAPNDTTTSDDEADDGAQTVELDVPNSVLEEAARRGIPLDNPIKLGFLALELGGEEFMRRNSSIYNTLIAIQKERDKEAEAQAAQKASADAAALMAQDYDAQLMARVAMLFRLHVPAERYEAFLADAGLAFEDLRANCLASLISRDPEEVALSQQILSLLQEQDALQARESPLPTIDAGQAEALQQQIEDLKSRLRDYRN